MRILVEENGIQNFLTESEEKTLEQFVHVSRVDRTSTIRNILELKCNRKRPVGQPRTGWISYILEVY